MRKSVISALLGVALLPCVIKTASAADFYWAGSSDMDHITILDPATIGAAQNGLKTFHLAEISEFDLWTDTGMEVDCAGNRMRMTSILNHLAGDGDAIDLSSRNADVNVWHTLQPGLQVDGADLVKMHDLVCKYPDEKPTGDDVMNFDSFQVALERISTMISEHQKGK